MGNFIEVTQINTKTKYMVNKLLIVSVTAKAPDHATLFLAHEATLIGLKQLNVEESYDEIKRLL